MTITKQRVILTDEERRTIVTALSEKLRVYAECNPFDKFVLVAAGEVESLALDSIMGREATLDEMCDTVGTFVSYYTRKGTCMINGREFDDTKTCLGDSDEIMGICREIYDNVR